MKDDKVIKFPGAVQKVFGQEFLDPISKLIVGPLSFHCTNCNETCHADFKNMVFRTVDFYCSNCGNFYKITNPAFSGTKKK